MLASNRTALDDWQVEVDQFGPLGEIGCIDEWQVVSVGQCTDCTSE